MGSALFLGLTCIFVAGLSVGPIRGHGVNDDRGGFSQQSPAEPRPGENKDAIEGETIRLACRFNPHLIRRGANNELVYYWQKTNKNGQDVAAINTNTLVKDYILDYSPQEGKYDLIISSAQYDRDNGHFECKIKEAGSGAEIQNTAYVVTILIPPGAPRITTSTTVAKEGELFSLKCSSQGGSPDPFIQWYRDNAPLQGQVTNGGTRDTATTNVLTIKPTINDDRAVYKCTAWNRAIREENKLTATYSLTVHYVPRVKVGPTNPLNVLKGTDAFMTCSVDANPSTNKIRWYKNDRLISHEHNHTIVNVVPNDSGIYSCVADNQVYNKDGSPGKGDLELQVQFGPSVNMLTEKESVVGESVQIKCNVNSNPPPHAIVWSKEEDTYFRQNGDVLNLDRVSADETGRYICTATNLLKPSGASLGIEKSGNGSVLIRVKHKPGDTEITPSNPVAVSGKPFTMSCDSRPPGWPKPDYKWWREGNEKQELSRHRNYSFISVHVSHEGRYYCQPYNSLGKGSIASVYLTVQEPPTITIPMPPQFTKKEDDRAFSLTCRARGKPKPTVTWWHNGQELNVDNTMYRIETRESIEDANVYVLQSVLFFESVSRKATNALSAADRGRYVCVYDNGIGSSAKAESSLKIEHSPVVKHTYNRVAFDVGENATLQCKMSAFPEPKFEWYFQSKLLDNYERRFNTNVSELGDDIYVGSLTIRDTRLEDYGDYKCRSWNSVGGDDENTIIKLVKKSAPDAPLQLEILEILSDSVTLRWTEGFNGGYANTEFVITYSADGETWKNESCRTMNPCRVIGLESRTEYRFKVLAINFRGHSVYSEQVQVTTKVNLKDMPNAFEAYFNSELNALTFRVEPTALRLLAKIEVREGNSQEWSQLTTVPILDAYVEVRLKPSPNGFDDMRIVLCLQSNDSWCGYEHLVKTDSLATYLRESKVFSLEQLILIIAVGGFFAFLAVIFLLCCCWKRRANLMKKDYDSEGANRAKVTTISPPYYSSHDSKGLVNGDTISDSNKTSPPPIYGTSSGNINMNGHIPQNYYLTGDGSDPSPSGCNENGQSELWMMKQDMMGNEGANEVAMSYHSAYGSTHSPLDPNAYSYSYYPHEDYQQLSEDNMNMKNALYAPHYDDGPAAYGTAQGSGMMGDPSTDPHMLSPLDPNKLNHQMQFEEEPDYSGSRGGSGRVIREIIV